ncbi:LysM peptidoglycan-binding domain-containing protein [Microbacterium sp. nov. GSS16]|uniref:LysM peptidoglycan-binding domain-containing protein n=1 Tax=Microbacterium sp. nov. GSS16 TaxID=3019890 RepID=UPI0023052FFF|nr:LysM peptidoglycan-binding domain-containing protein [Microbacterium sp. nov. GSS16]WCD91850.1 LysM peptidoglycan-binding domain-containing protein [Microbacterium sp. nov. GSS16]
MHTTTTRSAAMRLTAPAAVVGTLAAALTATPAAAEEIRASIAASHAPSMRSLSGGGPGLHASSHAAVRPTVAAPAEYTIRPGDTVSSIAARHGVTTTDLLSWNGLGWRSVIFPGQTLRLSPASAPSAPPTSPAAPAPAAVHTVVPGDTVFAIAKRYGTTVSAIMTSNGLGGSAMITPGQTLRVAAAPAAAPVSAVAPTAPPAAAPASHIVAAGDTLFGIARKHGTSVSALLQANGMGEGSIIYPGQTLRLSVPAPAPAAAGQRSAALDATQTAHAAHIVRIGRELGVPDRGIAIALATAMVESSMRNLDHGDRDSLGLFQQRPSQGWGTPEQAMDADRSIRAFYGGAANPNGGTTRGLLDIPDWQNMPFTDAAQAVQVSAYPDRYGMWEQQANQWLTALR